MRRTPKIILISTFILFIMIIASILTYRSLESQTIPASETAPASESSESSAETPAEKTAETPSDLEEIHHDGSVLGNSTTETLSNLMLINPNFKVSDEWIAHRKTELIDLTDTYGIVEGVSWNGRPLLDAAAAPHLSDMINAYIADAKTVTGEDHTLETRSCFRQFAPACGRLCAAVGTSDHHTGLTCDLIDPAYGTVLSTDEYDHHPEWQWLRKNSYKYGFIDRFPEAWAGGSMSEPLNVDASGTTGLFETWHYRYVGIPAATAIAAGKYNNGAYDSLEHYLLSVGYVTDLLDPASCTK